MICPKCREEIDVEDIDEPDILYHYTSQKGLLGILQKNKLWMTDIFYLNDSSELTHTLNLVKSEFKKREELLPPYRGIGGVYPLAQEDEINNKIHDTFKLIKLFIEIYSVVINHDTRIKNYVFSLSQREDDLSQWRSYCPPKGGFSIGFDYKRLVSILNKNERYLIKECIYDSKVKQELINLLLDPISNNIEVKKNFDKNTVSFDVVVKIMFYSSFLKDESFKDEQEYRIINNGSNIDKINHCEGKSMIIPYIEFLPVDDDKLPISKIIVGPTPHPELSKLSVQSLLKSEKYEGVEVEISKIPYRSW